MASVTWEQELERQRRDKDAFFARSPDSPLPAGAREHFRGLAYYAPDARYRFEAALIAGPLRRVVLARSGGDQVEYLRVGTFVLRLPRGEARLAALRAAGRGHQESLFLPFRDATSGRETYGAGRYLDAPAVAEGRWRVDFNLAYHPFCAYSERYTCPLPPRENWLAVPVEAGERSAPAR